MNWIRRAICSLIGCNQSYIKLTREISYLGCKRCKKITLVYLVNKLEMDEKKIKQLEDRAQLHFENVCK